MVKVQNLQKKFKMVKVGLFFLVVSCELCAGYSVKVMPRRRAPPNAHARSQQGWRPARPRNSPRRPRCASGHTHTRRTPTSRAVDAWLRLPGPGWPRAAVAHASRTIAPRHQIGRQGAGLPTEESRVPRPRRQITFMRRPNNYEKL
jgi:hypothetical protein